LWVSYDIDVMFRKTWVLAKGCRGKPKFLEKAKTMHQKAVLRYR